MWRNRREALGPGIEKRKAEVEDNEREVNEKREEGSGGQDCYGVSSAGPKLSTAVCSGSFAVPVEWQGGHVKLSRRYPATGFQCA